MIFDLKSGCQQAVIELHISHSYSEHMVVFLWAWLIRLLKQCREEVRKFSSGYFGNFKFIVIISLRRCLCFSVRLALCHITSFRSENQKETVVVPPCWASNIDRIRTLQYAKCILLCDFLLLHRECLRNHGETRTVFCSFQISSHHLE